MARLIPMMLEFGTANLRSAPLDDADATAEEVPDAEAEALESTEVDIDCGDVCAGEEECTAEIVHRG